MNASGMSERQDAEYEKGELLGDRFVFHVSLPSLQKMASYRIVETICCEYSARLSSSRGLTKESSRIEDFDLDDSDQEACYRLVESLRTPRRIENMLKKCLDEVLDEVRNWLSICFYVFHAMPAALFSKYNQYRHDLSCLVWLPNGKIDSRKSAAQMSRCEQMNPVLKFVLMSEYCLQDQIDTFDWKLLPEEYKEYISLVSFTDEQCFAYYWLCYLKNELHKVPTNRYGCPEAAMAAKCITYYRWPSSEYFWNCLNVEDQISVAESWLNNWRRVDDCFQARILGKMSWHQQRVLLSQIPADIILNFFFGSGSNSEQYAMWAWTHSKDTMTREEFDKLMSNVVYQDDKHRFFALIWDTIPAHFQRQVVEYVDRKIENLFQVVNASASDFKLLCKYMPQKSHSFWKQLVLSNVDQFANFADDPSAMHEFIDLALPRSDDLAQFKQSLARNDKMKYSCLRLLGSGKPEYVHLKLKYCMADHRAVHRYTMDLLMQTRTLEKGFYYTDIDEWIEMSDFIDRAFAGDASKAKEKKKHLISSYVAKWPHRNDRIELADEKRFANFVEIIESLFEDDELKVIKKSFLRSFLKLRTNSDAMWREKFVCRKFFQKFILGWCLANDESATREFKESLSGDKILTEFFTRLNRVYRQCDYFNPSILNDLDFYLEWYLGSEEKAREYKAEKFPKFFDDFSILNTFSKRRDKCSLRELMKWAFGGDEKAIRAFEAKKTYLSRR